jgi:acetyltransferase-like isoleucine patch superfamily enzyme
VNRAEFKALLLESIDNRDNPYHPFVWINGQPEIGANSHIGGFSEINAKGARVTIGEDCDIASFVAINAADSHRRCIGLAENIARRDIVIGDHVFIGSHSAVLGGAVIGHHSVIAAGTIVRAGVIPPFSLVSNDGVKPGYYRAEFEARHGSAPA